MTTINSTSRQTENRQRRRQHTILRPTARQTQPPRQPYRNGQPPRQPRNGQALAPSCRPATSTTFASRPRRSGWKPLPCATLASNPTNPATRHVTEDFATMTTRLQTTNDLAIGTEIFLHRRRMQHPSWTGTIIVHRRAPATPFRLSTRTSTARTRTPRRFTYVTGLDTHL